MYEASILRVFQQCGYQWTSENERIAYRYHFFRLQGYVRHVTHGAYKRAPGHSFGLGRLWIKRKNWTTDGTQLVCNTWAEIKYRPLVSYATNFYGKLFSVACRVINFIHQQEFPHSAHCVDPVDFVNSISSFERNIKGIPENDLETFVRQSVDCNLFQKAMDAVNRWGRGILISSNIHDIADFFPSTDRRRSLAALNHILMKINLLGKAKFVVIPKRHKLQRVYATGRRREWAKDSFFRRKQFVHSLRPYYSDKSSSKTHDAISIDMSAISSDLHPQYNLSDLELIVLHGMKFSWVRIGDPHMKQCDGFGQGSPISPGFASFYAGCVEQCNYDGCKPGVLTQTAWPTTLKLGTCTNRWIDDVYRMGFHKNFNNDNPYFYGPRCQLKQTFDNKWAGVTVLNHGRQFLAFWASDQIMSVLNADGFRAASWMHPQGFYGRRDLKGMIIGIICRILDFSKGPAWIVLDQVAIATQIMKNQGIPETIIRSAINIVSVKNVRLGLREQFENNPNRFSQAKERLQSAIQKHDGVTKLGAAIWN